MRIASAIVLIAAAAAHQQAAAQPSNTFLIGEIAPLSGPAATVGSRLNQVTRLWAEETNKKGGIKGRKIDLVTCNDEGRPEKAVICARDLLAKGVVLLINNSLTASILATLPVVAKGPVMVIPSPNVAPAADTYVFQVSPTDFMITTALATFVKSNGISRIGMIAATDSSGEVGVGNAQKAFPTAGIDAKVARIDLRSTDATSQLASVAGPDAKLIYSSYSGGGAATVVKSYFNLGLQQPLVVSYANLSASFISVVKDTLPPRLLGTGIASLVPASMKDAGDRQRAVAFSTAYQAVYRELPDMVNLTSKLTVDVVDAVLRNVDKVSDPNVVREYLETNPVPSVHTLRFSKTSHVGLTEANVMIVEWKDGAWIPARPVK